MPDRPDGYELNRRIQSRELIPTLLMIDALASLEFDMRQAAQGNPVGMTQWTEWVRKAKPNADAIVRVLFLVVAAGHLTADDIGTLRRELRDVSKVRRRPPRLIREPGPRKSPRLW